MVIIKMGKKGFVEIQFNWIFILVIGGIILVFFIGIAEKQKSVSEVKVSSKVRSDIKTIFTGAGSSTGTASIIDLVGKEISYNCEGYSVENLNPAQTGISFSPGKIKGFKVTTWSKDWGMPYRISNFLMVTSPNIKYIMIDNSPLAKELNKSLPPNFLVKGNNKQLLFNKEVIKETNNIKSEGNYRIRFIFFNHDPVGTEGLLDLTTLDDSDVSAINIVGNSLEGFGELRFYNKVENHWSSVPAGVSYYLGKESLFAAVFTDDYKSYNCNMQRAFRQMSIVTDIYQIRTNSLIRSYQQSGDTACATQLSLSLDSLQSTKANSDRLATSFPSQQEIAQIYQSASELRSRNNQLQRLSCREVY